MVVGTILDSVHPESNCIPIALCPNWIHQSHGIWRIWGQNIPYSRLKHQSGWICRNISAMSTTFRLGKILRVKYINKINCLLSANQLPDSSCLANKNITLYRHGVLHTSMVRIHQSWYASASSDLSHRKNT